MNSLNRKFYIDIAKFIAILSVIFVHLQLNGKSIPVRLISVGIPIVDRVWRLFSYTIVNSGLTMFMLISGAVRLNNTSNHFTIDYKRHYYDIFKFFLYYIIFSIPFYIYYNRKSLSWDCVLDFFKANYYSYTVAIYWYIPVFLVSFMLILPVLKKFSALSTKIDLYYVLSIYLIIEYVFKFIDISNNLKSNVIANFFIYVYIYPLIGDLICNKFTDSDLTIHKFLFFILFALVNWKLYGYSSIDNVHVSALILITLRYFSIRNSDFNTTQHTMIGKLIKFSALNSFMFYILHPYVVKFFYRVGDILLTESHGLFDYLTALMLLISNFFLTFLIIKMFLKLKYLFTRKMLEE